MSRIRIAIAAAAVLAACDNAKEIAGSPEVIGTGTVCPPGGTTLTYANFGQAFFGNAEGTIGYCNYCHASTKTGLARNGAPTHAVFDILGIIREHAQLIDAFAGKGPTPTTPQMPFILTPPLPAGVPNPQPIPTDQERTNLSVWLACGAP